MGYDIIVHNQPHTNEILNKGPLVELVGKLYMPFNDASILVLFVCLSDFHPNANKIFHAKWLELVSHKERNHIEDAFGNWPIKQKKRIAQKCKVFSLNCSLLILR